MEHQQQMEQQLHPANTLTYEQGHEQRAPSVALTAEPQLVALQAT